ncbi:hypothetical protein [Burkholderia pseudomallei]|uniref:hypothetical protein n=1 Tax=Burkholderia pseudomallei TaxID=28450 RepID=UPI000F0D97CE|nr:hypothetical protein [Burkholderia pseudomallei]CAJ6339639.1 putative bacteriophage protein [Burkholderia pseudomallei]VBS29039.1 putative bacteriophage protein [Burkholderia pseudomallei]
MMTDEMREALKLARHLIETRDVDRICIALIWIARNYPRLGGACFTLREYIEKCLGDEDFDYWQLNNGFGLRHPAQTRRDRLAWIDWMLEDQP